MDLIRVIPGEDSRTFRMVGELDLSCVDEVERALAAALTTPGDVTLDISQLTFMDSSGIALVVRCCQSLAGRGSLVLQSPTPMVQRLLDLCGLERIDNLKVLPGL